MSILQVYRKTIEKSRHLNLTFTGIKGIDRFLVIAAVVVALCLIIIKLSFGEAVPVAGKTELTVSGEYEEFLGKETAEALIREFEEANSGIRIVPVSKIGTDSNPVRPDLLFFDEGAFGALVKAGSLAALNSYVSNESRTKQYAIPLFSYMDLLFYNTEILKAAGFDRPPKTRNEFLVCAKAISAANGGAIYGAALGLSDKDPYALHRDLYSWFWAAGGDFGAADKPQFSGRTAIDTLAFIGRLYSEGALAPGLFDKTGADRLTEFENGKTAMIIASSKEIPAMQKKMAAAFGITVIPGTDSPAKSAAVLSRAYAGISAESALQDEAWSFLIFLAEHAPSLAAKTPGAVSDRYDGNDPLYAKVRDIFEATQEAQGFFGNPQWEAYERIAHEEMRTFLEQNKTPTDIAAAINKRWSLAGK